MMFAVLAALLSLPLWGLSDTVESIVTIVVLLAMLPGAGIDARLARILLVGPLSAMYILLWLFTAWLMTPETLNLPLWSQTAGVNDRSDVVYAVAYLVAGVIFFYKRAESQRRR